MYSIPESEWGAWWSFWIGEPDGESRLAETYVKVPHWCASKYFRQEHPFYDQAVSDGFRSILRGFHVYLPTIGNPRDFLCLCAKRAAIEVYRSNVGRTGRLPKPKVFPLREADGSIGESDHEGRVDVADMLERIRGFLEPPSTLTPEQFDLLVTGHSEGEISRATGMPKPTVHQRKVRTVRRIRARIGDLREILIG